MSVYTYGSGVDLFTVETEGTVANWRSESFYANRISRFEIPELNRLYSSPSNPLSGWSFDSDNMPITWNTSNNVVGVTNGGTEEVLFGSNVLLWERSEVVKDCDIQRLIWDVPVVETTEWGLPVYNINLTTDQPQVYVQKKDGTGVVTWLGINPVALHPQYSNIAYGIMNSVAYRIDLWNNFTNRKTGIIGSDNAYGTLPEFEDVTYNNENNQNFHAFSKDGKFSYRIAYSARNYAYAQMYVYIRDEDMFKKIIACYGLKFRYKGVIYKPIAEQGVIVGYTDDLSESSEWDEWHGLHDHVIPDVRPEPVPPTPSGDDVDDMPLGFEGYENGFIKHYQVTSGNLETISQKIAEDTEHLNAIDNIVSLKSYVIPTNYFIASSTSDRIYISGIDTTVDAPKITVTTSDYEIGSTTVSGKYGNASNPHFLDFAPYTQLECYIPFCGVVQLPDWVMYKTIHVILVSDIITGSCKGIVKCNGDIVAEKVGVLGIDAPFTSEANALKNSAMLQTVLNGANIGMQTLGSGLSGSYTGIAKGALQGIANIQQSIIAGNNNYTVSVGSSPDRIEYAMPSTCYIKKYFPVKEEPDNYLHTIGKPLMKKKTISEVSGYTVCSNVDTSSITCTEQEREMIKNILESGVYL